jgi:hypothetical protein
MRFISYNIDKLIYKYMRKDSVYSTVLDELLQNTIDLRVDYKSRFNGYKYGGYTLSIYRYNSTWYMCWKLI